MQGISSNETKNIIDQVTKLSGDLRHSVLMAKHFLKEVDCQQRCASACPSLGLLCSLMLSPPFFLDN